MAVVTTVLKAILCLCSVFLIAVILLQSGKGGLSAALTGIDGGIGSKAKARGRDALFAKLTRIAGIAFMVIALAIMIISRFFS